MQYSYLIGSLILLVVWVIIFLLRPDLKRGMLFISIIVLPIALISNFFYLHDYWNPVVISRYFRIEDLIYAFSVGGIASSIYPALFKKKYSIQNTVRDYKYILIVTTLITIIFLIIFNIKMGINSMYVITASFILWGLLLIFLRKDLIPNAIWSGILLVIIATIHYQIIIRLFPDFFSFWKLNNLSGFYFLKIPIEELFWIFSWGFVAAPAYEVTFGIKLIDKN